MKNYEDIYFDEYAFKLFPQTNIIVEFYGKNINITSEENLKFDSKNYSIFIN